MRVPYKTLQKVNLKI